MRSKWTVAACAAVAGGSLVWGASAQSNTPATTAAVPPAPAKTWADSITIKGDIRYRFENIEQEGVAGRERERLRVRLGAEAKVNDDVRAYVRLSTGDVDPVSGNKTLGDESARDQGFGKKSMILEMGYFDWSLLPEGSSSMDVLGGKMKNPFMVMQDLVWDFDLTFDGLAWQAKTKVDDSVELMAVAGYLWLNERAAAPDTRLYAGQAAAKVQFTDVPDEFYLLAGGSYYTYNNIQGNPVLDWSGANKSYGNSTLDLPAGSVTNKGYKTEFTDVEGFLQVGFWTFGLPVTVYGDYVVNNKADDLKTGYMYGLGIGKAKNPDTWELLYNYRNLEKDCVVGAFADSDSFGAGTDGRGHRVQAKYQLAKNWQMSATYFMDTKALAKPIDYKRLQVDLAAAF
jgi:hypothetical protein